MSATLSPDTTATALPRWFRYTQPMQRGDDVRRLQDLLKQADPAGAGREITTVDGLVGPGTRRAVMTFQARVGLPEVDGVVGPDTWAALWLALRGGNLATPAAVAATQAGLADATRRSREANGPARVLADNLRRLTEFHAVFQGNGACRWRLSEKGLEIEGRPQPGQAAPTTAAARAFEWFGTELRTVAVETGVPVELLAATACAEVLGDTRRYPTRGAASRAVREEPGFRDDASTPHRVSPGLMQTLISTARQMMPSRAVTRDALFEPLISIRAGALYIRSQAQQTLLDPPVVACAYNAGAVYFQDGPRNHWKMRQYPIGMPDHADRFVIFFNHIVRLAKDDPAILGAPEVPSFMRSLAA